MKNFLLKYSKILVRLSLIFCVLCAILLIAAQIALRYILPSQSVQQKLAGVLSDALNAQVSFESISASITGLNAKGVKITSDGGEIASAATLAAKIKLLELLMGNIHLKRIYIDGLNINIIRNEDGSFNFDKMFSSQEPQQADTAKTEETSLPDYLSVRDFQIHNGNVFYTDKQTGETASLINAALDLEDFSFDGLFRLSFSAKASYKGAAGKAENIPVAFSVYADLKKLADETSFADIKTLVLKRGGTDISLKGRVNNLASPKGDITITVKNFSERALEGFADGQKFSAGKAVLSFKAGYYNDTQKILAENFTADISNVLFSLGGESYGADNISLSFKGGYDTQTQKISAGKLTLNAGKLQITLKQGSFVIDNALLGFKGGYDIKQANVAAESFDFTADNAGINFGDYKYLVKNAALDFKGSYGVNSGKITADSLNCTITDTSLSLKHLNRFIANANLALKGAYDTAQGQLSLDNLDFETGNSKINAKGMFKSGKKNIYNFDVKADILLAEVLPFYPVLEPYKITGALNTELAFSQESAKGKITLKRGGGYYNRAGSFSNVNSTVDIASLNNINLRSLTGSLNGNPFKAALTYKAAGGKGNVNFNLQADTLLIKDESASAAADNPEEEKEVIDNNISVSEPVKQEWFLPPLNIKGSIDIGNLNMPFLNASSVTLRTDLTNFTPDLNKIGGTMLFSTQTGVIKDLYKLTNASIITKVLFASLGIVSRVINSLDVISLLNKVSKTVLPIGKNEAQPEKIKGSLPYDYFDINLDFVDGLTDIKDGNFVSSLLSFELSGKLDFDGNKIDMNVDAAPGKHESGGIMPLRLKINGTIDDPKGSMSMLSSAANLIGQGVFNNAGSRIIKKGVGGVLGVIGVGKKDKEENAPQDEFIPLEIVDAEQESEPAKEGPQGDIPAATNTKDSSNSAESSSKAP